jgi:uncharacterized protein YecT (DUF1311 family)
MRKTSLALAVPFLLSALAHAAGFDCAKAKTAQEKAICASPDLSAADDQMADVYRADLAAVQSEWDGGIRENQLAWLHNRDASCPATNSAGDLELCLSNLYVLRIEALRHMILQSGGVTFVLRSLELAASDQPSSSDAGDDPDKPERGYLSASWPLASNGAPEWQAWNRAIEAATAGVAGQTIGDSGQTDFGKIVSPGINTDVAASLGIVSLNLITATIANDWDGGGIHPNENSIQFNWLLKERRELKPEDIFHSKSGWDIFLQQQCDQYLHKTLDYDGISYESFMQPGQMAKAVHAIVTDPENWQIDSKGITIIFQAYAIACHACTPEPLLITWEKMTAMLNPEFALPSEACAARAPWGKMPDCKK